MPAVLPADGSYLFRVGGDDHVVQPGAGARGIINMREHRASRDVAKNLSGQPGGCQAGRNDGDGFHSASVPVPAPEIKASAFRSRQPSPKLTATNFPK